MEYAKPSVVFLGPVHALTLKPAGNNDPKNDACSGSNLKCLGVGDGHSQEAGWS